MKKVFLFFIFSFSFIIAFAQNNLPFADEVVAINKKYDSIWDSSKETIVFTGSSSVRLWKNLEVTFPDYQIINTGFGGSQASDLLIHLTELVLKYNPKKVFIYEGDNDVFSKKSTEDIVKTSKEIIFKIKEQSSETEIVIISVKPSRSRWKFRRKYKELNEELMQLSMDDPSIYYADVWKPMLKRRRPKKDIFVSDGLHMNQKGYDIWYSVIKNYIKLN